VLAVGVAAGAGLRGLGGSLPARVLSGGHGMNGAVGFAVDGGHVWAVSDPGNGGGSVTELNASDGGWIRTLSNDGWIQTLAHGGCIRGIVTGGSYRFTNPSTIAAVGTRIWVVDGEGSITVLTDR